MSNIAMRTTFHKIEGRACWLVLPEENEAGRLPLLCLAASEDFEAQWAQMAPAILPKVGAGACRPFALAAFSSEDWNADFSPWPAPGLSAKADAFAGKAEDTLAWLQGGLLPYVEAHAPVGDERFLLGYSLGGLFALWAAYRTDAFAGYGSCSGSLWYDGWMDFMRSHEPAGECRIYLSLGKKEGNARNPRMAAVDPATREAAVLLSHAQRVRDSVLHWHDGGHFQDAPGRLAQATCWLLQKA